MNILIVDDEVIIRTGLSTVIQWEEMGFRLLPSAESAEEALGRIASEHPHIILTDIRMGGMDGITMAGKVKEVLPETEIIVLTGYDDFAYVQQAIRSGIGDYLLKSSRPDEIIRAVMKAKQRLLSKWETHKADNMQRNAYRGKMLERLVTEGIDDPESLKQVPRLLGRLGLAAPAQAEEYAEQESPDSYKLLAAEGLPGRSTQQGADEPRRADHPHGEYERPPAGTGARAGAGSAPPAGATAQPYAGQNRRLQEPELQVLLLSVQGWGDTRASGGLLRFAVDNMLGELLPCETLQRQGDILAVLRTDDLGTEALRSELARISDKLKCVLFAAAGSPVRGLAQLPHSYREAVYAASFRSIAGSELLLLSETVKGRKGGRTVCSKEEESELAVLLKGGNPIDLRHFVERVMDAALVSPDATPASLQAYSQSVVIAAHRWLERTASALGLTDLPRLLPSLGEQADTGHAGSDALSLAPGTAGDGLGDPGSMKDTLYKRLRVIMETYYQYLSEDGVLYVKRAISYIQDNLDHALTLQQVAGHVHVNPNHFSEVFKRETGVTYIEFVMRERIRRAAEILSETPIKISEVAKKVGYEDIKYFSQLFKKFTGQTPSDFRSNREGK
ncbi:response regulator [Paenibacillus sp. FJAT-26967]|uniref:response regulator n=1 Tax=Paenibacillus sp. FJAT-26967 TaxID=1729690 RepID=UPI000A80E834|nr:response regulator [Paenibacillus sp. FJAT-26967]